MPERRVRGLRVPRPRRRRAHVPQLLAALTDKDLGVRCAASETLKTLARRQKAEAAVDGGAADGAGAVAALPAREPTASTPAGVDAEIVAQL